jgi:hypothetical protein
MKNIAVVLFMLIAASLFSVASASAIEVYGQISIQGDEIQLESFDGKIITISASQVRLNSAQEGLFRLRPNTIPADTFTLVEMVKNNGALKINHHNGLNIRRDEIICHEIYQPVCGRLPKTVCAEGMLCAQVMPVPQTFGNLCELNAAGATLIHKGECNDQDLFSNMPARIMPKRLPGMFR